LALCSVLTRGGVVRKGFGMLEKETRPRAFAAIELFLDLNHVSRSMIAGDLETVLIWFSITEATLRPLMLDRDIPSPRKQVKKPPSADLGTISRIMIADRTGLPRETVRRKINALLEAGLVAEEQHGHVRTVLDITRPDVMEAIEESYKAVRRYQQRLRDMDAE